MDSSITLRLPELETTKQQSSTVEPCVSGSEFSDEALTAEVSLGSREVVLAGVPEPVGSGTAFSPALGSDSACGVGPTGLKGSHRDRLRRQRKIRLELGRFFEHVKQGPRAIDSVIRLE